MTDKPTPKAVRDVKATEIPGSPKPQQVQIHAGNIGVLTVQLLGEINTKLTKILEKLNG